MPNYSYFCESDRIEIDVVKPMSEAGNSERCPICGGLVNRIWYAPNASVSRNGDEWNPGLKCRERDKKDTLRKIKAETGKELVEVGNDRMNHVRKKESSYSFNRAEMADIGRILDG
jgi:hypothetical protein